MIVMVEAENAAQARDIVEPGWKNSDYILDANHFQNVTFSAPKNRNHER